METKHSLSDLLALAERFPDLEVHVMRDDSGTLHSTTWTSRQACSANDRRYLVDGISSLRGNALCRSCFWDELEVNHEGWRSESDDDASINTTDEVLEILTELERWLAAPFELGATRSLVHDLEVLVDCHPAFESLLPSFRMRLETDRELLTRELAKDASEKIRRSIGSEAKNLERFGMQDAADDMRASGEHVLASHGTRLAQVVEVMLEDRLVRTSIAPHRLKDGLYLLASEPMLALFALERATECTLVRQSASVEGFTPDEVSAAAVLFDPTSPAFDDLDRALAAARAL